MANLLESSALWLGITEDPRIVYSLAAAVLLAAVSWFSGLARRDLLALLAPATLLRLCGAVVVAFGLAIVANGLPQGAHSLVMGLARFPLLLLALAYGPTAGLVCGLLFAAVTASAPLPSWPEAVFTLELLILGWLALYPSPRSVRWAGPLDAALAHLLTTGTAGVALLVWQDDGVTLMELLRLVGARLPGLALAWLLLALVGPGAYRRYLPHSRIAPGLGSAGAVHSGPAPDQGAFQHGLPARPARPERRLAEPDLKRDDPNG